MTARPLWLVLTTVMVVSLLAGCIPEAPPSAVSPRTTAAPAPATNVEEDDLPPLPKLPPPPVPTPPYPVPPGSRVSRTGQVSTGAAVKAGSSTAERKETTLLTLGDTKSPLYGFELRIPAESHQDDRDYTVSYAPITNTTFKNVTPVSPLITVENGGGYADKLITVKVPVRLEADDFAMGFYYDARTGQLEGLPLLGQDAQSVTLVTRHFSSFFVSALKVAVLDAAILNGDIDSGFRPGIDDWQFTNYGSYIEPGGHCAGMSVSAMWYYVTRPDGPKADLWGVMTATGSSPPRPPSGWMTARATGWLRWYRGTSTGSAGRTSCLTWQRARATPLPCEPSPMPCG